MASSNVPAFNNFIEFSWSIRLRTGILLSNGLDAGFSREVCPLPGPIEAANISFGSELGKFDTARREAFGPWATVLYSEPLADRISRSAPSAVAIGPASSA